ncbi:MAG: ribonuclease HII [Oleiphilaceae bacterium]|nr:ribonuclease HII [Oleiphilaceae bacterium]
MTARSRRYSPEEMIRLERLLWDTGYYHVAGVDEVGVGPLAGPLVAAAVVYPPGSEPLAVADSKVLSAARRVHLDGQIRAGAESIGIGRVEVAPLDEIGVYKAGLEAMRLAVEQLMPLADYLLVDARRIPGVEQGQSAYKKGDTFIYSVASASIVAKVYRDALMLDAGKRFPGYGFERHMGYGTAEHMAALGELGPCSIHRRSFEPVKKALASMATAADSSPVEAVRLGTTDVSGPNEEAL